MEVFVRTGAGRVLDSLAAYKECSPLVYLCCVVVSLYMLAHIGGLFSGFFLAYLGLLAVSVLPGLHRLENFERNC